MDLWSEFYSEKKYNFHSKTFEILKETHYDLWKILAGYTSKNNKCKSVSVEVDQIIGEGTECCVLEAMKMQNSLKIGATGKIKTVHVKPGDTVQADQILVELEWIINDFLNSITFLETFISGTLFLT